LSELQDMAINYHEDQFTKASTPIDDEGIIYLSECEQDDQSEKNKKQKFDDDDMFTFIFTQITIVQNNDWLF